MADEDKSERELPVETTEEARNTMEEPSEEEINDVDGNQEEREDSKETEGNLDEKPNNKELDEKGQRENEEKIEENETKAKNESSEKRESEEVPTEEIEEKDIEESSKEEKKELAEADEVGENNQTREEAAEDAPLATVETETEELVADTNEGLNEATVSTQEPHKDDNLVEGDQEAPFEESKEDKGEIVDHEEGKVVSLDEKGVVGEAGDSLNNEDNAQSGQPLTDSSAKDSELKKDSETAVANEPTNEEPTDAIEESKDSDGNDAKSTFEPTPDAEKLTEGTNNDNEVGDTDGDIEASSSSPVVPPAGQEELPVDASSHTPSPRLFSETPRVIEVQIELEGNAPYSVRVEVTSEVPEKLAFLGGFRNRNTLLEYHNRATQTPRKSNREKYLHIIQTHRDTQTVFEKNGMNQVCRDTSTQMAKPGLYVSVSEDKVMEAGEYLTSQSWLLIRTRAAVIIQSCARGMAGRKYAKYCKDKQQRIVAWHQNRKERMEAAREESIRDHMERRRHPLSNEDFNMLYSELEEWRLGEIEKIDAMCYSDDTKRRKAMTEMVKMEARLIEAIHRLKIEAKDENKEKKRLQKMNSMTAGKKWAVRNGEFVEVHTPFTLRAKDLRDIYTTLSLTNQTLDERLDILLHLKWTVKEFQSKLCTDIVELIDREADLLMRGRSEESLFGLRKRIMNLFATFIENPEYNPEAERYQIVPKFLSGARKVEHCKGCDRYLPREQFSFSIRKSRLSRCKGCTIQDNNARSRVNREYYDKVLLELQRLEQSKENNGNIIFLLQAQDLWYLIENIWGHKSIISSHSQLEDLILTRWDPSTQLSPWNCILLTREEAEAMENFDNSYDHFSDKFKHKIHSNHMVARHYFNRLNRLSNEIPQQLHEVHRESDLNSVSTGIIEEDPLPIES
eukprot:Nk52_evm62s152 gene=Nk52_evmTU62s152